MNIFFPASDCKAGMTVPPTASKSKPSISVTVEDFAESFRNCLNKIESDSMSTLIPGMLDVCAAARQSEEVEDYFYTKFSGIVVDCNVSKSSEAVAMFTKLHKFRLDEISHRDLYAMLPGCSEESIMDFCQMFSLEIIGEIARVRLEKEKKQTNMCAETVSENDQSILYYISGYIIRSLKKRYSNIKDKLKRDSKLKCVERMTQESGSRNMSAKFSKWTSKASRGGLKHPNDDTFLMVREIEIVIRSQVDKENMNAHSLLIAPLKESVLSSFMLKHYAEKLFSTVTLNTASVSEDIVNLFLTVRGYAATRLVRNQLRQSKTKAVSMRGGLKAPSRKTGNKNS